MQRFTGRVAFVTGGGHGIGRATCLRLAAEGAAVVTADVDDGAAGDTVRTVTEAGGTGVALHCDVLDRASVDTAVGAAVERFGRLDVLVNVAGGGLDDSWSAESGDEVWTRQIDFTLVGVVRCIRAALPHLTATAGSIVTVGSVNGLAAFGGEAYSAAKAGLTSLTQNLAVAHGPAGVRVNLVAPGTVRTRVWDGREDALDRLARIYPLGRVGEPTDIAAAIAFLASDDAAWITGIVLPVEGGVLAGVQKASMPPLPDSPVNRQR